MAHMTLSAVRPLLRLIRSEARLLRGVRGDVQFIKDEMESMKGFLLNLARTRAGAGGDYQLRAWMEQVMELAYDSRNCIVDYAQSGRPPGRHRRGLAGRLLRVVWLPKRVLVRRRVATRIRDLKVRAKEIGQRQQRYAVLVPPRTTDTTPAGAGGVTVDWAPQAGHKVLLRPPSSTHPARDSPRWAILAGPDILTQAKGELLQWLAERWEQNQTRSSTWLNTNILGVVTLDGVNGASLADQVYQHCSGSSLAGPLNFDCKVHITVQRPPLLVVILLDMLRQLRSQEYFRSMGGSTVEAWNEDRITRALRECLRGKRLLLLLSDMDYPIIWYYINKRLQRLQCSARSVVVFCTNDAEVAVKCYPSEKKVYSLVDSCCKKVVALVPTKFDLDEDRRFHLLVKQILDKCTPDVYCMNLFLHALLSNPNRTEQELEILSESLDPGRCATAIERQSLMLKFCYHGLHKDYQNCLWYSAAFTQGIFKVRRASLLRRWVAEGLIKRDGRSGATAEADRCFDALSTQKLLLPREVGGTGNVKSCGPNAFLSPMIMDAATDEAFLDANHLPADLQLHFSIRNGIQLRSMTEPDGAAVDSAMSPQRNTRMKHQMTRMMAFLKYLPSSSSFRLLRVLELEDYKGFKKRHLKNICKIHQLKYLNLRNTDVEQLPKEINQLLLLETLDIRGTRVKELNAVLPMLKHLLAGFTSLANQEDIVKSKESFSTLRLRHGASGMKNLEVLSHVKVSENVREFWAAARNDLTMLRKLGVVLPGRRRYNFDEIRQFNRCLASLSIRVEPRGDRVSAPAAALTLPSCLKSLRICGIVGWSPSSIRELRQLAKITLRETSLREVDLLPILGALEGLVCLRLLYHSLVEAAHPVFEAGQFRSLMDLVVEDDRIQSISFAPGTSPMLGKMVWSFHHMNSLSGVQNLPSLRYLELKRGTYEPDGLINLRQDIPNHVNFSFNPPEEGQRQESPPPVGAAAAS